MACKKCKKKKKGKEGKEGVIPEEDKLAFKNLYNSPEKKKMVKTIIINLIIITALLIFLLN